MNLAVKTTEAVAAGRGRWLALAAIVVSVLVLGLDMTILVTALPTLSAKLGASTDQLQWISAAYTLTLAGFLLPAGVLADRLGRRRLLLAGLLLFGVASVAASQVTSVDALIAMRAVMGVGGAIILPLSIATLPTIFSEAERPRAVAFAGAGAFLGLPLGPLVAGWLLTHYDWGSIFLINGPVVVLALVGVWLFLPESRDRSAPRLDWLGAILEVAGVSALVYGIIEQPAYGWADPRVLAGLIGGVALLIAFVVWELRNRAPLVDLRLFGNPRFTWATAGFVVVGFALMGVLFVFAPFLQIVQGNDAQATGIRLLPLIAAVMVGALASARLLARLGIRVMLPAGQLTSATGLVLLSRIGPDTGYGYMAAALAVIGLGISLAMIPALDTILGALPASQTGAGTALTRTLQNVGGSFGVAIMGSILNNGYRTELTGHVAGLPARVRDLAEGSVAGAAVVAQHLPPPVGAALVHAAGNAYAAGMGEVLLVSAGLMAAGALLIAIFMPSAGKAEQRETAENAVVAPA
jgi:MFS transporter, DHA2 family, multidrug resistance protein